MVAADDKLISSSGETIIVPVNETSSQPPKLPVVETVYVYVVGSMIATTGLPTISNLFPPRKLRPTPGGNPPSSIAKVAPPPIVNLIGSISLFKHKF